MMRIKLLFCLTALALGAHAETFTVDIDHAEISFKVRHLMLSDVKGSFNSFEGSVEYDMEAGKLVSIEGSINAASIDTNSDKRDDHLRNDDFFNTAEYPKLTFKSTSIEKTGGNTYTVKGKLTVLGIARDVTLPVTVAGPVEDPWGNQRIGLASETVLNRRNLGITNSPAAMIGDEVKVSINAEAVMAPAE
jgi:polyisoprenoid-binding protein YceI